jgi:hypothetical protein
MSISDRIPITSYQRLLDHIFLAALHDVIRYSNTVGSRTNAQINSGIDAARWLMSTSTGSAFRLTCYDICTLRNVDQRIVRKYTVKELLKIGVDVLEIAYQRRIVSVGGRKRRKAAPPKKKRQRASRK